MSVLASTCTCGHAMVCDYSGATRFAADLQREIMEAHVEYCGGAVTEEEHDSLRAYASGISNLSYVRTSPEELSA